VFCVVKSWLVRPRLVSLPFSDHAELLLDDPADHSKLLQFLAEGQAGGKWASIEFRPLNAGTQFRNWGDYQDGKDCAIHCLDLRPSLDELFHGLQKDSIQRKILRAKREGVTCEEGRSESHLREFYRLAVLTRRRQALPPPPVHWYHNILHCLGENATIRLACMRDRAIAAIFTLNHKETLTYKYGCSDATCHRFGGMPFLLWQAIGDAKKEGCVQFDLGRSDLTNSGLITFKSRFGAVQSKLTYKKFPRGRSEPGPEDRKLKLAKRIFAHIPDKMLILAGKLLYRHIG